MYIFLTSDHSTGGATLITRSVRQSLLESPRRENQSSIKRYVTARTRTRWIRMAVHFVRVPSHAHATAERWRRISTSPLPDFHGGTAALRARRPVRPTGPLSVHRAISHLYVEK